MPTSKREARPRTYTLISQWAGPACIAAAFLVMALWTWRKWPDIVVDFGRELYGPWQLVASKVLYVDIAYFNGLFSPYLNALWFRLFGVSLTTLICCNLALLTVLISIIYRIFRIACDHLTAMLSSLVLVCVFAFSQYTPAGNYNYVSPSSHELTHGLGLAVGMIFCLWRYVLRGQPWMCLAAGLLLGLVFLTKAEVFLATAAAAALGRAVLHLSDRPSERQTAVGVLSFAGAALLPIALGLTFLSTQMPATQALHGIAGTWKGLLESQAASHPFYQHGLGFDRPWTNGVMMLRTFAGLLLLAGALAVADMACKLRPRRRVPILGVSIALLAAALLVRLLPVPWLMSGREPWLAPWLIVGPPLPLAALGIGAVLTLYSITGRVDWHTTRRLAPLAFWAVFAFVLLGKIILRSRVYHDGFALAMPAALLLVVCFVRLVPTALRKIYGGGTLFR